MDFSGPVTRSPDGYCLILVVVDCFTRYPFAIPLRDKEPDTLAQALMTEVFAHTGLPRAVHSDNEPVIVARALEIIFAKLGIRRTRSSVRHPQGNSPAEKFIRYLHAAFSIILPQYTAWPGTVPLILFAFRALPQITTGFSPFFLMYGRHPLLPLQASLQGSQDIGFSDDSTTQGYADKVIECLVQTFREVRRRQDVASRNNASRRDMDEKRYTVEFTRGDPILLFEPKCTTRFVSEARQLLCPKEDEYGKWGLPWSGPHVVEKKLRVNTYLIYHGGRRQSESVNVDSIRLFHPFKDISSTHISPSALFPPRRKKTSKSRKPEDSSGTPMSIDEPEFIVKGASRISELAEGDMCIITNPKDFFEPVSVLRIITWDEDGFLEGQFYGRHTFEWYIDRRLAKFPFQPAWYQPSDERFYYLPKPLHTSHLLSK